MSVVLGPEVSLGAGLELRHCWGPSRSPLHTAGNVVFSERGKVSLAAEELGRTERGHGDNGRAAWRLDSR